MDEWIDRLKGRILGEPWLATVGRNKLVSHLDEARESMRWRYIINVASLFLSSDTKLVRAVTDTTADLLKLMEPLDFLEMDAKLRWCELTNELNRGFTIEQMTQSKRPCLALCLASGIANGHTRQRAVEALSRYYDPVCIPFLLIRVTDWVPQVAQAAAKALDAYLIPENIPVFIRFSPLLEALRRRDRTQTGSLSKTALQRAIALLTSPDARKPLLQALSGAGLSLTRRECFKYLLCIDSSEISETIDLAVAGSDPQLRRLAVSAAAAQLDPDRLLPLLRQTIQDKCPSVRRVALESLVNKFGDSAVADLQQALIDRAQGIRSFAAYYLKKFAPDFDVAQYYRDQLKTDTTHGTVIVALGYTGSKQDCALVESYLSSPFAALRKAAVSCIGHLDADTYRDQLAQLVTDPAPSVSKAATLAIAPHAFMVRNEILAIFRASSDQTVQLNCLRLIGNFEKWDRITDLLLMATEAENVIRDRALVHIDGWISQYRSTWQYTLPTKRQTDLFLAALDKATPILPTGQREFLHGFDKTLATVI